MTQTKNSKTLWAILMNAPGTEAKELYDEATRILVSRNLIKAPRERKSKGETSGIKTNHPAG